jgi:F420-non-reducing hydrogenase small subunit
MDIKEVPRADVGIITGCVRNEENRLRARRMRESCRLIVALGTCACFGGVPGLGNLFSQEEILREVFLNTPSTVNVRRVIPTDVPQFEQRVYPLDQVIQVDLKLPGCPTPTQLIGDALTCLVTGKKFELPKKSVCDECERKIEEKPIKVLKRAYEEPAEETCLLEQGFLCVGPATRAGCEAVCPAVGVGCRGCMGPCEAVKEQGSKMLSALASILELAEPEKIEEALAQNEDKFIADPIGSFYRFSLPASIIPQKVRR